MTTVHTRDAAPTTQGRFSLHGLVRADATDRPVGAGLSVLPAFGLLRGARRRSGLGVVLPRGRCPPRGRRRRRRRAQLGAGVGEAFYNGRRTSPTRPEVAVDGERQLLRRRHLGLVLDGRHGHQRHQVQRPGQQLWARSFSGDGNYKDWATDVTVDDAGNVYVTGASGRAPDGRVRLVTSSTTRTARSRGRSTSAATPAADDGRARSGLDASGNVFVAGNARRRDRSAASTSYERVRDRQVRRPNGNATLGQPPYNQRSGTTRIEDIASIAQGNVYVCGSATT